jgi:hypothetical protein
MTFCASGAPQDALLDVGCGRAANGDIHAPRTATSRRARPLCRLLPRVGTARREAEEDLSKAR